MKFLSTSAILAIAATLTATTFGSTAAIQTAARSSVSVPATVIAQGETMPLAAKLQGKPVVVDIYASWCPGCKNIAPTLSKLRQQYGTTANFVVFDVTDSKKTKTSIQMAASLGLTSFFNSNKSQTSTVAIIDPATGKVMKQFRNNADLAEYSSVLDRAISQGHAGAAMGKSDMMKKP
jgi:thiol-disulfide isomerase/thioredoxin